MSLRSLIYFLLSVIVATVGAAMLLGSRVTEGSKVTLYDPVWMSIATGLISAGLTSVLFTIVREIDQRDAARSDKRVDRLIELERELHQGLTQLRRALMLAADTDSRRIYSVHPFHEVTNEITNAVGTVRLDGVGLALKALYDEQVTVLTKRGNAEVRLLAVDPCSDVFGLMCKEEARDLAAMTSAVIGVTDAVARLRDDDEAASRGVRVQLKWTRRIVPVKITRVDDWMAVSARFPGEGSGERAFFEQYTTDDERAFGQLERVFLRMWNDPDAREPTADDVEQARVRLADLRARHEEGRQDR